MSDWTSEFVTLIEDCEKCSESLTDWENQFVDSLSRQIANDRRPSAKQIETLDNIWNKATAKG